MAAKAENARIPYSVIKTFKVVLFIFAWGVPACAMAQTTSNAIPQENDVLEVKPLYQEDPISLFPLEGEPTSATRQGAASPATSATTSVPIEDNLIIPVIVSEEELSVIDPATAGLFHAEAAGGLGMDMWAGTDRAQMKAIFKALPDRVNSKTLRSLAKRLLLTSAETPELEGDNEAISSDGIAVLKMRVDRLFALGYGKEALELVSAAGLDNDQSTYFAEQLLEIHLIENDLAQSCNLVGRQKDKFGAAYWQKNLIFCNLWQGDLEGANFGLTILRDYGHDDPLFYALADRMMGLDTKLPKDKKITPLSLAMFRAAKLPLPDNLLTIDTDLNVLRALINHPQTETGIRLYAAEEGVRLGLVTGGELADLYSAQNFTAEEIKAPLSAAEADYSPYTRALLYQAAVAEPTEEARAVIIEKALDFARRDGVYGITLAAFEELIGAMPIRADLWHFADEAARSLYIIGRSEPAGIWINQLADQAIRNPEAVQELDQLWAMARIASADQRTLQNEEEGRRGWASHMQASIEDGGEVEILRRLDLAYSLIEAFQDSAVSMQAWQEMAQREANLLAVMPNPAETRLLELAANSNQVAATAGRVIAMLGEMDLQNLSAISIINAIKALQQVGLTKDARRLALEVALENGL